MNQTFSSARFGRLLRNYWRDNAWSLVTAMGVLFVIMAVSLLLMVYTNPPDTAKDGRLVGFLGLSLVLWPLFTHQVATTYNDLNRALSALMIPASLFEKWLLLWVVTGLGFVLCFFSFFTIIDAIGIYYVNHREWSQGILDHFSKNNIPRTIGRVDYTELDKIPIWVVWILLHPFTLAVTLLFRKYTLAIGVFVGLLLFGLGLYLNQHYVQMMLGESVIVRNAFPFSGFGVTKAAAVVSIFPSRYLALPQPLGDIIRWTVGIAAVGLLYAVSYFRLKEREI